MNIHFTNKSLFYDLNKQSIATVKVGSHMYGLNNERSDIDYLSIYIEPIKNRDSFMWTHHQLQFKDDKIDYNFSSIQTFIRNTLTGDATINFEVIHSKDLLQTDLAWLYEYKDFFINYNIIKSYLGLAKRDLKYWNKDTKNAKFHNGESNKKLSHFVRGVLFAKLLLEDNFDFNLEIKHTFSEFKYNDLELLSRIKNGSLDFSFDYLISIISSYMEQLRILNNKKLEEGAIHRYMKTDILAKLDIEIQKTVEKLDTEINFLDYDDLFYKALEEGVEY